MNGYIHPVAAPIPYWIRWVMITILQHGRGEPPGLVEEICIERGLAYECIPIYETLDLPSISSSHLVVLGGQMSVNDDREYPFLEAERATIREYLRCSRPVLGICLGSQQIARACGAQVYPLVREIGWSEVLRAPDARLAGFPARATVFQWHGETFDLPENGRLEYTGNRVKHQVFTLGSALGIQFHIEMTRDLIERWCTDLEPGYRQQILSETNQYLAGSTALCRRMMDWFAGGARR
jgi:GMP synthase-like glutamine amidotransferase